MATRTTTRTRRSRTVTRRSRTTRNGPGRPAGSKSRPNIPIRQAVFEVLDDIGDQSDIQELAKQVKKRTRKGVESFNLYPARIAWRKKNGVYGDNRTYKGQPDRNMTKATAGLKMSTGDLPKAQLLMKQLKLNMPAVAQFFEKMGSANRAHESALALAYFAGRSVEIRG